MPATDEDVVRELLHRYVGGVRPPASSIATGVAARQRRRDRRRLVSVAGATAALGTAATVVAATAGHHPPAPGDRAATGRAVIRLTADQRVLYRLSSVAAAQPLNRGRRYAVMSTEGTDVRDTTVIDSRTGNMWSYQKGSGGNPSGTGFSARYSPTAAQFAAMPTDVTALRTALITQWDGQRKPARNPLWRKSSGPRVVPLRVAVTADDKVFQQASDLLWNPLVGPALRSALYRVLAEVPGVKVIPTARDSIGRPAIEISRTDASGRPGGKSDGITYATYESPRTGVTLESTVTYPPGSDIVTPQDPHGIGTVIDETVYLRAGWASAVPADPYGG